MKLLHTPLILSALVLSAIATPAAAEVSANFGATSNYLWRGISLSNEGPAIYGGLDFSHESGIYAGLWQSSEGGTGSAETDLYAGYSTEFSGVSVDVGAIAYAYPQNDAANFNELYASVGFGPVSASVANDSENKTTYTTLGAEYAGVSLTFGNAAFDGGAGDYTHIDLSYSPADSLTLGLSKNDIDGDDTPRLYVSYGIDFEVK
ncbi:MAG: TorF family putative porin [Gammaproteobacteria bacterium]|nr:TorF family putative porin [Gammaproteobacteria bacterium]